MKVTEVSSLMNKITDELVGRDDMFTENLTNVVDAGDELLTLTSVDNYVKTLVNHIGRVIFVNRDYRGRVPSVLMDGWEFGSILEKVSFEIPEAEENESWQLVNGASYDPNIFYEPKVTVKFYNARDTFSIPYSIAYKQVRESFSSAEQLNGFISGLVNAVEKSMTVKMDALVMRTINNLMSETIYDEFTTGDYTMSSGVRAVNVLYDYKQETGDDTLTAANCMQSTEFCKYLAKTMNNYVGYLTTMSTLFNVGGAERFTPTDVLHFVMLQDVESTFNSYLQSSTFHDEYTRLPKHETVPYWQAPKETGKHAMKFETVSKIDVVNSWGHNVKCGGVVGIMFDRDALGVTCMDRRTTSNFNPKAEFYNNWQKMDAGYFNDINENCVVFFVA